LARSHDLVIIEGIWQYHAFATWRALRVTGIPYFVYPHGMLDPWFKRTYPLKHLKKWAYWPWADYRVLRDAQAVLFTTEQERLLARQSFWLYQANEVVVGYGTSAPPGDAEQQRELFLSRFPQLRGQRILLFLSRIHPKKGVDLLLEAFAAVASSDPRLQLVIAGPDQVGWQAQLQQRAAALGIADRITWPGMLSGDLKWGAFRAAELFCLPSHQENFGIVVAEALACGLPVTIAEPVNIASEAASHGVV
jgi:glycosyltransferase involved in cell wall biosynthesis